MSHNTKQIRLSNVELLRILAMFGVLIVHTDFGALHEPTYTELLSKPYYCVSRILIESFALVSVNVFVLISGWFGITFRWRGIANLLFQTFFFFFGIYAVLVLIGQQTLNLQGIYNCLMLSQNGWFVKAYLGMYLLSPALNAMIIQLQKNQIRAIILALFVFQTVYGWLSDGASWINMGYGAFSFSGLYLLARYVSVYKPVTFMGGGKVNLSVYVICSLLTASAITFFVWRNSSLWSRFMYYTSPFVITASLFLLVAVSQWQFKNKFINSVAVSCFAVYLMHFIIFPTYMRPTIQWIAQHYGGIAMIGLTFLLLLTFFVCAIVIDRIRLFIWNCFLAPHFND